VSLTRLLVEKIPFLLLALVFGIVAVRAQAAQGAVQEFGLFSFYERLLFACYGILAYLVRAVAPVNLSAFYPYPVKVGGSLPLVYYLAPFGVAALAAAVVWSLRRARDVAFGSLFFFLNVVLVLQVFPVGSAIIADRYTYLSYIGVGLVIASGYQFMIRGARARQNMVGTAGILLLTAILVPATRARCEVWKDSISLWTNVMDKYPTLGLAYRNRARAYMLEGQNDRAMSDLDRGLSLDPEDHESLTNRGTLWFLNGDNQRALADLDKSLRLYPADATPWNTRGAVRSSMGELDSAMADFDRAIELKKGYAEAYLNRAVAFSAMKQFDRSLPDYDACIRLQPGNAKAHLWRGKARFGMGDTTGAIEDFGLALKIDPNFGEAQLALESLRGRTR